MAEILACAVITKAVSLQTGKSYIALMGAGGSEAKQWVAPLYRAICDLAAAEGCDRVLIVGRPGWRRLLVPLGARRVGEILVVENFRGGCNGQRRDG
jgi:hypothetical protein